MSESRELECTLTEEVLLRAVRRVREMHGEPVVVEACGKFCMGYLKDGRFTPAELGPADELWDNPETYVKPSSFDTPSAQDSRR